MEKKNLCCLLALALALIGYDISANGQCACADIWFQTKVTDLLLKNGQSNYSIKVVKAKSNHGNEPLSQHRFNTTISDTGLLKFSFPTGGGIDTLVFVLSNLTTGEAMSIITIGLNPDIPYHIDLSKFTKGQYIFDWTKIEACLRNKSAKKELEKIIECDGRKFTRIYTDANSYYPNSIKPIDLKYFALE
jgi:hypothetical protein